MIHFVVLVGTAPALERVSSRLLPALERTRLFDGERIERAGASRTWAAAAISVPDPTAPHRFAVDEDAMVVVNGPALGPGNGHGKRNLAERALEVYRSGGSG
ncbi:MAG: hypothetical protein ACRDWD_08040, partial [Acidimicrobiia bacterium]